MLASLHSFTHVVRVSEHEIDELGHVNNTVYLQYMEGIARAHADSLGATLEVMRTLGTVPVARQTVITYHRPAFAGDELRVRTEIISSSGVRSTRVYEIRRAATDELLAEGQTEWVWIDPQRGRPKAPPRELLTMFGWEEAARA